MSYTLFLSDVHLDPREPRITADFKATLQGPAQQADALYILGDLFEVWLGDDDLSSFNRDIIQTLHQFTSTTAVPTYFMRGNRDFLIGKRFAQATGITLLPDPTIINLYGQKTLLLHGDTLCVHDHKYQQFRKKTHHPFFKPLAYAIPLSLRRYAADKMRSKSFEHYHVTEDALMDACPQEVDRIMHYYGVQRMIHGHTHRPSIHPNQRIVLGSWHDHASLLYFYQDRLPLIKRA